MLHQLVFARVTPRRTLGGLEGRCRRTRRHLRDLGRSPTMSLPRPNGSAAITDCNDVSKGRPGVFARLPSRRSAGAGARIGRERARKGAKYRNPLATNDGLKTLRRKEFSRNSLTPLDRDRSLKRTVNPFVGSSSLPPEPTKPPVRGGFVLCWGGPRPHPGRARTRFSRGVRFQTVHHVVEVTLEEMRVGVESHGRSLSLLGAAIATLTLLAACAPVSSTTTACPSV